MDDKEQNVGVIAKIFHIFGEIGVLFCFLIVRGLSWLQICSAFDQKRSKHQGFDPQKLIYVASQESHKGNSHNLTKGLLHGSCTALHVGVCSAVYVGLCTDAVASL